MSNTLKYIHKAYPNVPIDRSFQGDSKLDWSAGRVCNISPAFAGNGPGTNSNGVGGITGSTAYLIAMCKIDAQMTLPKVYVQADVYKFEVDKDYPLRASYDSTYDTASTTTASSADYTAADKLRVGFGVFEMARDGTSDGSLTDTYYKDYLDWNSQGIRQISDSSDSGLVVSGIKSETFTRNQLRQGVEFLPGLMGQHKRTYWVCMLIGAAEDVSVDGVLSAKSSTDPTWADTSPFDATNIDAVTPSYTGNRIINTFGSALDIMIRCAPTMGRPQ